MITFLHSSNGQSNLYKKGKKYAKALKAYFGFDIQEINSISFDAYR